LALRVFRAEREVDARPAHHAATSEADPHAACGLLVFFGEPQDALSPEAAVGVAKSFHLPAAGGGPPEGEHAAIAGLAGDEEGVVRFVGRFGEDDRIWLELAAVEEISAVERRQRFPRTLRFTLAADLHDRVAGAHRRGGMKMKWAGELD